MSEPTTTLGVSRWKVRVNCGYLHHATSLNMRFHLASFITGDFLVSTVGYLMNEEGDPIPLMESDDDTVVNYQTSVFRTDGNWDSEFGHPEVLEDEEVLGIVHYESDVLASRGHEMVVEALLEHDSVVDAVSFTNEDLLAYIPYVV